MLRLGISIKRAIHQENRKRAGDDGRRIGALSFSFSSVSYDNPPPPPPPPPTLADQRDRGRDAGVGPVFHVQSEGFQVHNIQLLLLVSRLFKFVSHFVLLLCVLKGSLENKRLRTLEN